MLTKQYYIYIMTNYSNTVLYTGVTNNLVRRVFEHRQHLTPGFTKRYHITKLVYFELCGEIESAIAREKQIKGGSRQDKINLIEEFNPEWNDLYLHIIS